MDRKSVLFCSSCVNVRVALELSYVDEDAEGVVMAMLLVNIEPLKSNGVKSLSEAGAGAYLQNWKNAVALGVDGDGVELFVSICMNCSFAKLLGDGTSTLTESSQSLRGSQLFADVEVALRLGLLDEVDVDVAGWDAEMAIELIGDTGAASAVGSGTLCATWQIEL